MRFTFGDMTKEVNVFNLGRQPRDINDQTFEVNSIENLTSEHEEAWRKKQRQSLIRSLMILI